LAHITPLLLHYVGHASEVRPDAAPRCGSQRRDDKEQKGRHRTGFALNSGD
jgi:hypothetical protein